MIKNQPARFYFYLLGRRVGIEAHVDKLCKWRDERNCCIVLNAFANTSDDESIRCGKHRVEECTTRIDSRIRRTNETLAACEVVAFNFLHTDHGIVITQNAHHTEWDGAQWDKRRSRYCASAQWLAAWRCLYAFNHNAGELIERHGRSAARTNELTRSSQ